jgi:hypothetical protein
VDGGRCKKILSEVDGVLMVEGTSHGGLLGKCSSSFCSIEVQCSMEAFVCRFCPKVGRLQSVIDKFTKGIIWRNLHSPDHRRYTKLSNENNDPNALMEYRQRRGH